MSLITRITRLFHADMNAVLDQIEEPELLLKQALREMEWLITQDEKQLKLLDLEQQQMMRKQDELKQSLTEMEQQLVICFQSDKDGLAHSLIKRKLEVQHYLKLLANKLSLSVENSQQLSEQFKQHQSQLLSMRQKAEIFDRDNTRSQTTSQWNAPTFVVSAEDVEVTFLHEKQKWSQS